MAAPRGGSDAFDSRAMLADLDGFARDRACCFDWEVSQYDKHRRSQGPDRAGLEMYKPLLLIILKHCPRGRPAFVQIRDIWLALLEKFDIMDRSLSARRLSPDVWATDAANRIRIMLKHVLDLKASGTAFVPLKLQELLDAARVDPRDRGERPKAKPQPPPSRALVRHESAASSVEVCCFACNCPMCRKPMEVSSSELEDSAQVAPENDLEEVSLVVAPVAPRMVAKRPAHAKAPPSKKSRVGSQIKIVYRNNPVKSASAYILLDGRYCCGVSKKQHNEYAEFIRIVASELEDGTIYGKALAVERCKQLIHR